MGASEARSSSRVPEGESRPDPWDGDELVLVELVSRILDRGVVITGDVTISVAGVDLVHLGLSVHAAAVETLRTRPGPPTGGERNGAP